MLSLSQDIDPRLQKSSSQLGDCVSFKDIIFPVDKDGNILTKEGKIAEEVEWGWLKIKRRPGATMYIMGGVAESSAGKRSLAFDNDGIEITFKRDVKQLSIHGGSGTPPVANPFRSTPLIADWYYQSGESDRKRFATYDSSIETGERYTKQETISDRWTGRSITKVHLYNKAIEAHVDKICFEPFDIPAYLKNRIDHLRQTSEQFAKDYEKHQKAFDHRILKLQDQLGELYSGKVDASAAVSGFNRVLGDLGFSPIQIGPISSWDWPCIFESLILAAMMAVAIAAVSEATIGEAPVELLEKVLSSYGVASPNFQLYLKMLKLGQEIIVALDRCSS